eukprot:15464439-Alexandrium_andersonii.AAC.2
MEPWRPFPHNCQSQRPNTIALSQRTPCKQAQTHSQLQWLLPCQTQSQGKLPRLAPGLAFLEPSRGS